MVLPRSPREPSVAKRQVHTTVAPFRDVVDFYRLQFRLLRRWSGGGAALIRRAFETFVVAAISLVATAWLVPGISVRDLPSAVIFSLILVSLTTLARPLLIGLLSGISVLLVGISTMLLQVLAFSLLALHPTAIAVRSLGDAVLAAVVFSLADAIFTAGLSIGDDSAFFGTLTRQLAARHRGTARDARPGCVLIQIDGLAHPILEKQIRAGHLPNLGRWLSSEGMTLDGWETLLPSQTSASQAGILHGNNDGIPGFRWWDKQTQRLLISNHPADARTIMARISDGRGLLANGGASIGNLLPGDATRSFLTAATIEDPAQELRRSHVLDWFFISPYSYLRWLALSIGEVIKEIVQAQRERLSGVAPQGVRSFPYPLARAAATVLLRHLTAALVIEEMYRAAPIIYVDLVDYDELAHHSGPERVEARDALTGLDRIVGFFQKAALDAPRPYRFVVLSDHGQSPGATFRQRYGKTLADVLHELVGEGVTVRAATAHVENWGRLTPLFSEAVGRPRLIRRLTHDTFRRRAGGATDSDLHDLIVAASGNLALISFPRVSGRVKMETIEVNHPGLIDGLVRHPGIGLVMVRSQVAGALVRSAGGVHYLDEGRVEGVDPIEVFGPHAAAALKRLDEMADCGDLVVISQYDRASGEIAAFEEQIGAHGGLGGWQTRAFILHPTEWVVGKSVVGAVALHGLIRAWLDADASPASEAVARSPSRSRE